ncbi:DUF1540 domain-containing protein [Deinococcus hopiensis]|uniref:DUF1540 domain-containing protein n=1 Tax=Deinococcus hopiensis KR-140 TaxID=695939 RepID=A0A1W1UGQ4_9DEIO|nr:DUF1540 domain-containing protein [Deinococcus hopiensis]SMB80276.1 protein of unknown function [Deinococcus hopiensis KR-140]
MTQRNEGETSVVGSCDATNCRYNENRECHAGQIQVSLSGGTAQCMTYDPQGSQPGLGEQPRQGNS